MESQNLSIMWNWKVIFWWNNKVYQLPMILEPKIQLECNSLQYICVHFCEEQFQIQQSSNKRRHNTFSVSTLPNLLLLVYNPKGSLDFLHQMSDCSLLSWAHLRCISNSKLRNHKYESLVDKTQTSFCSKSLLRKRHHRLNTCPQLEMKDNNQYLIIINQYNDLVYSTQSKSSRLSNIMNQSNFL